MPWPTFKTVTRFIADNTPLNGRIVQFERNVQDYLRSLVLELEARLAMSGETYLWNKRQGVKVLSQDGADVTFNANGNYSVTAAYWEARPPAGEIWFVNRMLFEIEDSGLTGWATYGALAALTNGVEAQVVRGTGSGATVLEYLTDPNAGQVKTNHDWKFQKYDVDLNAGPGVDFVSGRWTFGRSGPNSGLLLDGDTDDALRLVMQDNLTGIDNHRFQVTYVILGTEQVDGDKL